MMQLILHETILEHREFEVVKKMPSLLLPFCFRNISYSTFTCGYFEIY